jgi:colanic acid/amylovoran biosynthesis glycosyltransferase
MRIAYLCSVYPAVSHTFILREVAALRRRGIEIATLAIHRSAPDQILTDADREAARTTWAVLPPRMPTLLGSHARAVLTRPRRYWATLHLSLRLAAQGSRGRLWGLFYFTEAIMVWLRCQRQGIRHIHAHFTSPAADVALLAAHFGGADNSSGRGWTWSFSAHGTDMIDSGQASLREKVRRAKFVVCVSDFGRAQLLRLVPEDQWLKIHTVRCGVDVEAFARTASRNGAGAQLRLLTVGRLHPTKGHAILLEALAELIAGGTDARLTVIGRGPTLAGLRRRSERLGVAPHVDFVGAVGQDEIGDYYADADVFCLPSFGEGVPVVLMEAMATGLPVVASAVMGVPELVEDGRTGLLVPPARPDLLARALEHLAGAPELRRRMGTAGRKKVATEFTIERSADRLAEMYARLG